jgi:transposase
VGAWVGFRNASLVLGSAFGGWCVGLVGWYPVGMERRFRGPQQVVSEEVLRWADPEIFRLVDLVEQVDTSGFVGDYRGDGGGGVPYDPRLMLVTVWWCEQRGMRGPQDMARACREQLSLRAIWRRDQVPSAATFRRFIGGHPPGWQRVQTSLLGCCGQAELVDVSLTATDSTPMGVPAALSKTLSAARITVLIDEAEQELARLRTRLAAMAEDGDISGVVEYGCGPLRRAEQRLLVRLQRLRTAEVVGRERAARQHEQERDTDLARVRRWQDVVDKHTTDLAAMTARQVQAVAVYEEKVAAGRKPRGPAPRPPQQHPHIRAKTAALARARARLAAAISRAGPQTPRDGPRGQANTTDPHSRILKGKNTVRWVLGRLLTITVTAGQISLAGLLSPAGNDYDGLLPNLAATTRNCHQAGISQPFGHHLADSGFASAHTLTSPAPIEGTLLVCVTNEHDQTRGQARTPHVEHRRDMAARLATTEGQALYRRRSPMVEPVFAHLLRTDRRLHTRGPTQHTEILAMITAYNAAKYLKYAPLKGAQTLRIHPPERVP